MTGLLNLDDPQTIGLLNLGLGILAGNTGRPGDLGAGVMQGLNNYQQMMQMQQRNRMLQEQQDMQREQYGWQKQKYDDEQSAVAQATALHPELGPLFRLNPAAAIKAAYPSAHVNQADPYYTLIPTEGGLGSFDNRTGKLQIIAGPDGRPVVKSSDSPMVRGAVKGAESEAAANWKPNTDIEGRVYTDAQVSRMAGMPTNNFSTPYPVTFGAPGTTATDRRESTMTDASVGVRNPSNPGMGITVPTEAEKAARRRAAEVAAESGAKKEATMSGIGEIIDQAREILQGPVKPTSSGVGTVVDAVGKAVGYAPEGAAQADALEAIGGALVAKMPRMEGPQSNYDVENYKVMAGRVGDSTLPISRRVQALETVEKLWRKYDKASPMASQPKQAAPKAPMRGQVVDGYKFKGGNPADPNNWERQ